MAHVLIMPRQGNTVESCIIQEWTVQEGDAVKADTTVCVIETDKAAFEVPAGAEGLVLKILHPQGDDVPVLKPIAVIGQVGENWQTAVPAGDAGSPPADAPVPAASASAPVSAASSTGLAGNTVSPRARNRAAKEGINAAGLPGSGPGGRIIERDVIAALAERPPLTAAAKAFAVQTSTQTAAWAAARAGAGLPPVGTGLGGRLTVADIAGNVPVGLPAEGASGSPENLPLPEGRITETPVKGIRKLIADRMLASLADSAQFTLNASAGAVRLQTLRKRFKAGADNKDGFSELAAITINDLILYAVSRVLPAYPYMNALKTGDVLTTYEWVHLGMAVDTPRGLMVPVIRNASLLSLPQISAEAKRLAAACQGGQIKPEELGGSTFTVSNLGSFGITGFTPVLNAPEVAILGVCGIELKPVEDPSGCCCGDSPASYAFEPHIGFSLTINHQVVDGAPAARFLKALCRAVADIDLLLAAG